MGVINLYTNGFLLIFKFIFIIFAAHLATSCSAPFENHCCTHSNPHDGGTMFLRNVDISYKTTRCHNPEDHDLYNQHKNF
jgi:hypothetical protein